MFVQAFVAQATIERFHEVALLQLARYNVVPFDPGAFAPVPNGIGGRLGSVVADHHPRQSGSLANDRPA